MSLGVVILAHDQPERTGQLAAHLAAQGCAVVIHLDVRASAAAMDKLKAVVGSTERVAYAPRRRCEWGMFSLVEACLDSLRLMFERWPEVTHVCQLSGSCLPIKPIDALQKHLADHRGVDFIEAVPVADDPWVVGGLSIERFTLYHPLSWKRRRWLFDRSVDVQRKLGIKRKMPGQLVPHIGSQWWCLTRETLDRILADPGLPDYCRFFKTTWIPDETFFQTLVARHATKMIKTSLTFVQFDPRGRPHVLFDDHAEELKHVPAFFARKAWAGADRLYDTFLDLELGRKLPTLANPLPFEQRFREAHMRHRSGRRGLISQGRHPGSRMDRPFDTARAYVVFDGPEALLPQLNADLGAKRGVIAHGRLFAPGHVPFSGGAPRFAGNLSATPEIRDYMRTHFLAKLIWAERDSLQSFHHVLGRHGDIDDFMLSDPMAHIVWVEDAWLLRLYQTCPLGVSNADTAFHRARAAAYRIADRLSGKSPASGRGSAKPTETAKVLRLSLPDLLGGGVQTAERIANFLPKRVRDATLFSSVTLPVGFDRFLRALVEESPQDQALAEILEAVEAHNTLRRVLRRKT